MPESNASTSAPAKAALSVTLPSDREILMTRVFAAPRRLVFEAHTASPSTCEPSDERRGRDGPR